MLELCVLRQSRAARQLWIYAHTRAALIPTPELKPGWPAREEESPEVAARKEVAGDSRHGHRCTRTGGGRKQWGARARATCVGVAWGHNLTKECPGVVRKCHDGGKWARNERMREVCIEQRPSV